MTPLANAAEGHGLVHSSVRHTVEAYSLTRDDAVAALLAKQQMLDAYEERVEEAATRIRLQEQNLEAADRRMVQFKEELRDATDVARTRYASEKAQLHAARVSARTRAVSESEQYQEKLKPLCTEHIAELARLGNSVTAEFQAMQARYSVAESTLRGEHVAEHAQLGAEFQAMQARYSAAEQSLQHGSHANRQRLRRSFRRSRVSMELQKAVLLKDGLACGKPRTACTRRCRSLRPARTK